MQKSEQHTVTIPAEFAGLRLDAALAKLIPAYSRSQIQECIAAGSALINGLPEKGKHKLKGGEEVIITITLKEQPKWEPQDIPLDIIHEDEAIILINKPAGLVVHPGAGNGDRTLLNALLHHAPCLQDLPRAGILHRLDKDTSGILVIAKTQEALRDLSIQLKKRLLVREYQTVIYGTMISGGTVDAPIDRHYLQRKRMAVSDTGRSAVTHYRVAEKYRSHTRLNVRLETGRTHQIRVHMSHIHHPIVGDTLYGGRVQLSKGMSQELIDVIRGFKRQALHAYALGLTHPISGEFVRFEAPLPEDMQVLIATLQQDTKGADRR